jgi:O-antigen/teichoic acid export membrane protein
MVEKIKTLLFSQTIKDTSITFLGLGVTAVVGFIFTVILARVFGPEQFGVFSAISALIAIVYSLGDLGIAPAIINFLPKVEKGREKIIGTGFLLEFVVGLILIIFFAVLALFHNAIIPGSLPQHLLLAGLLSFNYLLIGFIQSIFTADRDFVKLSASQIIDALAKIIFVWVLLSLASVSIDTVLIANILSTLLALILTFGREALSIKPVLDVPEFSRIFHFSKWIAVSRLFSVLISRIDVLFLNLLSSSYQAGIFAAGSRITLLFALIVSSLGAVINPRFSRFKEKKEIALYIKKLLLMISLLCVFMIITAVFARQIIEIVFGSKYEEAILVFQLLTLTMIPFVFLVITTSALLYTYNQSAFYAKITAFQVAAIILIDLALIPSLGFYAPVLALGVTNLLVLIISSLKLRSLMG